MDPKVNVSIWASSWLLVFMAISDGLHNVVEVRFSPNERRVFQRTRGANDHRGQRKPH
jgi:hypothetical protein